MPSDAYPGRMATSIINAYSLPHSTAMYSTSSIGFTINPAEVDAGGMVRCAYPYDGNSMGTDNEGCGGGSYPANNFIGFMKQHACCPSYGKLCSPNRPAGDRWHCSYNEVVINAYTWKARLPRVIESVFFPTDCPVEHRDGSEARARRIRDQFIGKYGLAKADVPVVSFSCREARAGREPFRHVA